jgi:hypothetical protein
VIPMHEAGSFRERTARVFYHEGRVYRALAGSALKDYQTLAQLPFFSKATASGDIVPTKEISLGAVPIPAELGGNWAGLLQHEKVPFISYPYEWCFGMLKEAALLQLDLLLQALPQDFIPKDSSAYNFQFIGAKPVFIDISSFEKLKAGEPWVGYRQFCQMFLYPLMLQVYKEIPFQNALRSSLDGIEISEMYGLVSRSDLFRAGVFKHVYLHHKLQTQMAGSRQDVRGELKDLGFGKELIKANVLGLRKLVDRLNLAPAKTVWVDYAAHNSYSGQDAAAKRDFIEKVVSLKKRSLVWDLGCNTGAFSKIAAHNSDYVVSMDSDCQTIENLFAELKSSRLKNILPLVMNLANPSPNQGWRGIERKDLPSRGKPQLVLALALIHHMVIASNIPLAEFIAWLRSLDAELVIEFVSREDPMVKTLLANKEDIYWDYDRNYFEGCLAAHFHIELRQRLVSGTRELYYCVKK